jgi:hypothetical protein
MKSFDEALAIAPEHPRAKSSKQRLIQWMENAAVGR